MTSVISMIRYYDLIAENCVTEAKSKRSRSIILRYCSIIENPSVV